MPLRRKLAFALVMVLAVLGLLEGALRVAGWPVGRYRFMFARTELLYEPSARITAGYGPLAYTIETNAFGMRGEEIGVAKPPGVVRIAALGDSITDGFFVDNDATYPAILQDILRERGHRVQVLNVARGGKSIDHEFRLLRGFAHLSPDVVLLTFCTNDIVEIHGQKLERLTQPPAGGSTAFSDTISRLVVGHTAIGECLFDLLIRLQSRAPANDPRARPDQPATAQRPDRYAIPGGSDYDQNVREFRARYFDKDGLILGDGFTPGVERTVRNYLHVLELLRQHCRSQGATLVFQYYPAYSEIYDPASPLRMRDRLRDWCAEAGVPFLDFTPALRAHGADKVLHLAPVDYHLNPDGNQVLAEAVADFLEQGQFLAAKR